MPRDNDFNEPAPKKSNTLWYVLGGVGAGLFLFCCLCPGGCGGYFYYQDQQNEKKVVAEAGTSITAEALVSGYSDSAHKGKVLAVTGKASPTGLLGITEMSTTGTKLMFVPSATEREKFQQLKAGDTVTIKGLCSGKSGDAIQFANCHLVVK